MENRTLLFLALVFVTFLMWQEWQKDYGPKPVTPTVTGEQGKTTGAADSGDVPTANESTGRQTSASSTSDVPGEKSTLQKQQRISVKTDLFGIEIDTLGGDLRTVDLLKYPVEVDKPEQPFRLMSEDHNNLFIAQSGFANKKSSTDYLVKAPNHNTIYSAAQTSYAMKDGEDRLDVSMSWTSPEGVVFTKHFIFERGSYVVQVKHAVANKSGKEWRGNSYFQLQRNKDAKDGTSQFVYSYLGGVVYSPEEKYKKISFDDMKDENLKRDIKGGWAAMIQHYFLAAIIPDASQAQSYYSYSINNDTRFALGYQSQQLSVTPGGTGEISSRLFVGPKLQNTLEKVAPGLELTVDYGWLTILSKPLFWLLDWLHRMLGNWGWAIIVLTIMVKGAFYKLSEKGYKSSANMKRIAPRMQALKERCGDDKQKYAMAMQEMFRKEKVNPMGGCLPILVQIPVFIALYWVLLESVELRQAPWALWIIDMSRADPYFVLPVLYGITMFIQNKLNPAPPDPMMAKMMMMMPIGLTVLFAFFPAGLVLYWVVSNILSIAQQAYITKVVLADGKPVS
ncbi:MAG: membrane protein insertase YidC [Gammaproteobacteria bacterium]|nr:membrane protein insertase YidC [Gammaproteobacteria bacterium]MDH5654097.1 membrane protein insertase YidC [Gammaproteobacteria bacterium]